MRTYLATLFRLLALMLLLLPACSATPQSSTSDRSGTPITRHVRVDGHSLRVRVANLDRRPAGSPALILESGGGAPLETWDPVLSAFAGLAAVVAYDRAGTGESVWDSLPPTPERVNARLRRLLAQLDVRPPYIMVGHSWGGALARYYAGTYPSEIAGILYIDPTDITLTEADQIAIFQSFGAGASDYEGFTRLMQRAMERVPASLRAESEVILGILRSDPAKRGLQTAPHVPTSVILAGRVAAPPQNLVPFNAGLYAAAMHESQVRRLRGWVRSGGNFQIAQNAGHIVHADDPQIIINEVRHLLRQSR